MRPLLSVFAWIGISLLTVFWMVPMFFIYLVHRWVDPKLKTNHALAGRWGRGLVRLAPFSQVVVKGRENLPTDRPVILMANHQSYVDVPVLYFLNHQFKWMADRGLFQIPVFGWAMWMAGYIPVRRGNARAGWKALERAKGWLSRGISIFVFPEGTRSHTGLFGRFQTGGFRLAALTQTPIVPVVLVGTRYLLPRKTWVFRIGIKLHIEILPPIKPPPEDPAELHRFAKETRAKMHRVYRDNFRKFL